MGEVKVTKVQKWGMGGGADQGCPLVIVQSFYLAHLHDNRSERECTTVRQWHHL